MDRASLERMLGQGLSLAEIGRRLQRHESTVAYWVAKHGLQASGRERHKARGALDREELERLVVAGATLAEIAEQAERGKATVRHWLRRYGLKTTNQVGRRRSEGSRIALDAGPDRMRMECSSHGETDYALDARGYYRCTQCRSDAVSRRRRRIKTTLVEEMGGSCQVCGYSRCHAEVEAGVTSLGVRAA
jgi:transposase